MSRRPLKWLLGLTAAGLAGNALTYRRRLADLPTVDGVGHGTGRYVVFQAEGTQVDVAALAAAAAWAEARGLAVLDLVPDDLDADRAVDLARRVDPQRYRRDRLAVGRGACQLVLVDGDLLERMDRKPPDGPVPPEVLAALLVEAKRYAPVDCDLAILPGLHAAPGGSRVLHDDEAGAAGAVVGLGLLAVGVVLAPLWGLLAVVAYLAQPVLAGSRGRRRPFVAAARTSAPQPDGPKLEADRAEYRARFADLDTLFEPRRDDCPWCGGRDLALKVRSGDLAQHKPGEFRLERCRGCGHVFQNPRLTPEGLDLYYRDFYSGEYANVLTPKFQSDGPRYEQRADLVRRHYEGGEPERWLDVGTGHGHFCLAARDRFPATRFEALDRGEAVLAAERRGWIDRAHLGLLPDLADELADQFDVVTMHHCLEHTRAPREQLAAARRTLRPGGYLSIEVPDPECFAGSLLGRWWGPWFQPQHQHMIPIDNLCAALREEGFSIVATERREAHEQFEATIGLFLVLHRLAPQPDMPWRPARPFAMLRRALVFTAGVPLLVLSGLLDRLVAPLVSRLPRGSNAYRVLARLDGGLTADVAHLGDFAMPEWGPRLLDALAPVVGRPVDYASPPAPADRDLAPWAFETRLRGAPAGWQGPLVVRPVDDRAEVEREAAAIRLSNAQGLRAPAVRAAFDWSIVTDRPEGTRLLELIGRDFGRFDELLAGFAAHHAALHDRTVGTADAALPTVDDPFAELARIDAARYGRQVAWLREHARPSGPLVLCHGGFEPMCMFVDNDGDITVTNWRAALRAEREFDMGLTLLTFWVAPMFVPHRAIRAQFKMIRNKLASRYLRSYGDAAFDKQKVAWWQAFHAVRSLGQLDDSYAAEGSAFRAPDRRNLPKGLEKELDRLFRIVTARERRKAS